MPAVVVAMGLAFNVVNGLLQGSWLFHLGPARAVRWLLDPRFLAGTALFLAGMTLNWRADAALRRLRAPGCALHSVLERVPVMTEAGARTAWVVATNVFIETARGWRLAAHHASPGSPHEAQEIDEPASVLH